LAGVVDEDIQPAAAFLDLGRTRLQAQPRSRRCEREGRAARALDFFNGYLRRLGRSR